MRAFYSRKSGIPLSQRLDRTEDIAKLLHIKERLEMASGTLIANPIPEEAEIPLETIKPLIEKALKDAGGIQGKELTPFLLTRLGELTAGQTLKANIALIKNNALIAAMIALDHQNHKI